MPDNMDVTKMKVADLKRELKLRGLSTTGNKTELAERLQASDFSFEDTTISGEDLLEDEDAVLTDEEKILDENELLKSPRHGTTDKTNIKKLFDSSEDVSSTIAEFPAASTVGAKKVVLKRKISCNIGFAAEASTTSTDEDTSPAKLIKVSDTKAIEEIKIDENTAATKPVTQLTAQERLELRAKKFGITATASTTADSSVKNSTGVVEHDSTAKSLPAAVNNEKEAELLKKRAERFGCVVSSKMAQLDAAERLQKRKERFGGAAAAETKATVAPISGVSSSSDVWAEKARMRLERFKNTKSSTTEPAAAAASN